MKEQITDLFGEVPVTWPEVRHWLAVVPCIDPDSPRAEQYARSWDVPGKIRAAKLTGAWEEVSALTTPRPHFRLGRQIFRRW